ncbi:SPOR domain-containing protein, partial [Erythrobacteraceae bacterium CFH 75059]|uniref:SPOR domain-containing protein n=1 Tax=Qipengyuania thermophila TaxID=2509361 RepID=UPI00102271F1
RTEPPAPSPTRSAARAPAERTPASAPSRNAADTAAARSGSNAAPATRNGAAAPAAAAARPAFGRNAREGAGGTAAAARPAHPARFWVQVAAGSNADAFAFDWRRLTRAHADVLRGRTPHVAAAGRRHRLVIGPFASAKAADEAVAKMRAAGMDVLRFDSAAGEEVVALD